MPQDMHSKAKTFRLVFLHEARVLIADRTLPLVLTLFSVLIGYAIYNGIVETRARDIAVASILAQQDSRYTSNIDQLRRINAGAEVPAPFSNPADPANIGSGGIGGRYAYVPTNPLAPMAFGQSDMIPNYYLVTYRSRVNFMYDSEIENPWNLLSGRFDVAFVIVYLLPLFIFAMSYNLLSAEREQGTLRMLLSQPLTLTRLVLAKVSIRACAILACAILIPLIALLIFRVETHSATSLVQLGAWAVLVCAYGLFWFAVAVIANAFSRSSAANALTLVASWVVFVLILPVLLNLAVSIASPAPSRTELATQTRLITVDGLRRYQKLLSADYRYSNQPEMLLPKDGRFAVQPRPQAAFMLQRDVDAEIQKLLDRFDAQLEGQQSLVDGWGIISPAIIVHEGLATLAGNGSQRYLHFQRQVATFHTAWKQFFEPRILEGVAMTEADFAAIPAWVWQEETLRRQLSDVSARTLQIIALVLIVGGIGFWRLKKSSAV
jgi:ABC-2 type transport system permease protein